MPPGRGADACRVRLGIWPTPLQHLDDSGGYSVKREDLWGFALDGSKVRADQLAARSGVLLDPVFAGPAGHTFCARPPQPAPGGDRRSVVLVASCGLPACFDALNAGGDR